MSLERAAQRLDQARKRYANARYPDGEAQIALHRAELAYELAWRRKYDPVVRAAHQGRAT